MELNKVHRKLVVTNESSWVNVMLCLFCLVHEFQNLLSLHINTCDFGKIYLN